MKYTHWLLAFVLWMCSVAAAGADYTFIVAGLGGAPEYERRFREQAQALAQFAAESGSPEHTTTLMGENATAASIRKAFVALAARMRADDALTIVLLGHGSFDGEEYRYNIPGPDLTGGELAELFARAPARRQLIVNATSASGAVAERWAHPGRLVITATKSGGERTATRFAEFWLRASTTPAADRNKDDLVNAEEAFVWAERQVAAAFKADTALATEHARLVGPAPGDFAVARFGAAREAPGDAQAAGLLARRGALELQLEDIKGKRDSLPADAYYDQLESVLVRMAEVQRQIDARGAAVAVGGDG